MLVKELLVFFAFLSECGGFKRLAHSLRALGEPTERKHFYRDPVLGITLTDKRRILRYLLNGIIFIALKSARHLILDLG